MNSKVEKCSIQVLSYPALLKTVAGCLCLTRQRAGCIVDVEYRRWSLLAWTAHILGILTQAVVNDGNVQVCTRQSGAAATLNIGPGPSESRLACLPGQPSWQLNTLAALRAPPPPPEHSNPPGPASHLCPTSDLENARSPAWPGRTVNTHGQTPSSSDLQLP